MKSGFVTIIGQTNAGKSTLLNRILKKKVAIATSKVQTTRNAIQGIYNAENVQIVFIDTPGLLKPHHQLDNYMKKAALSSLGGVEGVLFLIDSSLSFPEDFVKEMKSRLETLDVPLFLVFNKIDLATYAHMEQIKKAYTSYFPTAKKLEISALDGFGVDDLLKEIIAILPDQEAFYDEKTISNHPVSFLFSEIIREQLLINLRQEIPHSAAVKIESIEKKSDTTHIHGIILVERDSQKAIVIGSKGNMIRKIGIGARKEMEEILHRKVNLKLVVRVEENWRNSERILQEYGYKD